MGMSAGQSPATAAAWIVGVVCLFGISSVLGNDDDSARPEQTAEHLGPDFDDGNGFGQQPARGSQGSDGEKSDGKRDKDKAPDEDRGVGTRPAGPAIRTYLVTRIIDGDTLELGNGEAVRLVGIDTPEAGECGYERAAENLARLVLGEQVRLGISDEDRDGYGRLLRYVDVGTMDAGLRLIKNGLAIARYDSRDGYGFHPREPRYIAADRGSPTINCAAPVPLVQQPPSGGNCTPGYRPCVPPYPPDVDCADVNGPIHVSGSDPHGLDADGDGVACEWG